MPTSASEPRLPDAPNMDWTRLTAVPVQVNKIYPKNPTPLRCPSPYDAPERKSRPGGSNGTRRYEASSGRPVGSGRTVGRSLTGQTSLAGRSSAPAWAYRRYCSPLAEMNAFGRADLFGRWRAWRWRVGSRCPWLRVCRASRFGGRGRSRRPNRLGWQPECRCAYRR